MHTYTIVHGISSNDTIVSEQCYQHDPRFRYPSIPLETDPITTEQPTCYKK